MSTVYLIRHGRTEANERRLYCGSTDLPLSPAGRKELEALSYSVGKAQFITSGMLRTEQTLEILFGPVTHRTEPKLREMDFGAFEMRGFEELKDDSSYQSWISGDNESKPAPGGESGKQMTARALEAFQALRSEGEDFVVVTHGGVIAAIMNALFPGEGKNRYQWQPEPGRGCAVSDDGWRPIP